MKLTKKIMLFILLICALFISFFFLAFHVVITKPIEEQKVVRAGKIIAGARSVLTNETRRIRTFSDDWSMWDAMHSYVSNPTEVFEKDIAPQQTLKDTEFSILLILNLKKEIFVLEGYDHARKTSLSFDLLSQKKGRLWNFVERSFNLEKSFSGIVQSEHGPMLLVSSPILHSDNSGPRNGRVVAGRIIDQYYEKKITQAIDETTHLLPAEKDGPGAGGDLYMEEKHSNMVIYAPIKDINGNHILTIRVDAQKRIFEILEHAHRFFITLLIAGFILLGIVFFIMIHHLVVRRVTRISSETGKIVSFEDLSQRVPVSLSDEITFLSRNINKMLHRLQIEHQRMDEIEHMLTLNEKLVCLGRVSAGIAHEVNNPLFAISNFVQRIKKVLPSGDPKMDEIIRLLENEIRRVRDITRNMHHYTIKQIEEPSVSDLVVIINDAVKIVEWSKQLKRTVVDFKYKNSSFSLFCNPETLQQVFMNLIINAVQAMEGEGKLVIDIEDDEENKEYRIHFIDNGPGISDEIKPVLFSPFQTGNPGKGSGLGLYISNTIIMNHGGSITLDENYKEGAHLIVRVPKKGGPLNDSKGSTAADR
jgi:signal transduction histidine kinase